MVLQQYGARAISNVQDSNTTEYMDTVENEGARRRAITVGMGLNRQGQGLHIGDDEKLESVDPVRVPAKLFPSSSMTVVARGLDEVKDEAVLAKFLAGISDQPTARQVYNRIDTYPSTVAITLSVAVGFAQAAIL